MPSNEHHQWLQKRDWLAVYGVMAHPDRDLDLLMRKYKEKDEHGRLPHHWMQRKLRHTHMFLPMWACCRFAGISRPSPHETIKAKLPSTLPVGVEPVLRSSACSPTLPRKLVRWIGRGCAACTHQCLLGRVKCMGGSNHDRMQTATSSSMSTMTSWCVQCSNTAILNFFERLLAIARYTATPSCFLLFE